MIILCIIFFVSLFLILHSYIFFPVSLKLIYKFFQSKSAPKEIEPQFPQVCIIMSVYNEEKVIEKKIKSIINSHYPAEKLSIYIGSDASSDGTNAIMRQWASQYPRFKFFEYSERRGKSSVLNDLLDEILKDYKPDPDIIYVFTDASVFLGEETIQTLIQNFNSKEIALADARIVPVSQLQGGISHSEKFYLGREADIKFMEGEIWGCMMGVFGGCFAVRSNFACKVPPQLVVDDFYITMRVLEQGGKAIYDNKAVCFEGIPDEMKEEFKRKKRISSGNFQNLLAFLHFLWSGPLSRWYCYVSHKVLRWMGPFFIIGMLASSFVLCMIGLWFFRWPFISLLILFLFFPLLDYFLFSLKIRIPMLRHIRYFVMMNIALFSGFINFSRGIRKSSWEPPKRMNDL